MAYGEVARISGIVTDPWFDSFKIKLIGADDPLAKAAFAIDPRYSGRLPTWIFGDFVGGIGVAEVYLYPKTLGDASATAKSGKK